MNETHVTVVGNVITELSNRRLADGTAVSNFRIASTERRYDRATGGWVDGDRLYLDVTCWRRLAENAVASLVKGDPVVVTGRLHTRQYEHEGRPRSSVTLDAHSVAADLTRCTAVVRRDRPASAAPGPAADRTDGTDGTHGADTAADHASLAAEGPAGAPEAAGPATGLVGATPAAGA